MVEIKWEYPLGHRAWVWPGSASIWRETSSFLIETELAAAVEFTPLAYNINQSQEGNTP